LDAKITSRVFRKLKLDSDNKSCFDCPSKNPAWTSIPFGVFLCPACAAVHRRMGVHITFVRSSVLDSWTADQLINMIVGGNERCSSFFKKRGWAADGADSRTSKYTSKAAVQYKEHLSKEAAKQRSTILTTMLGDSPAAEPQATPAIDTDKGLDDLERELLGAAKPKTALASPAAVKVASITTPTRASVVSEAPKTISQSESEIKEQPAEVKEEPEQAYPAARTVIKKTPKKPVVVDSKDDDDNETEDSLTMSLRASKPKASKASAALNLSTKSTKPRKGIVSSGAKILSSSGKEVDALDSAMNGVNLDPKPEVKEEPAPAPEKNKPKEKPREEPKEANRDFSKSTSISSDQYFGRNEYAESTSEERSRLAKYSNSNSISSDAFFEREQTHEEEDGTEFSLSDMASSFIRSIKTRYG